MSAAQQEQQQRHQHPQQGQQQQQHEPPGPMDPGSNTGAASAEELQVNCAAANV